MKTGMRIPELRSPYDKVDGLVYFGRMIDKIRLHAAGKLPSEYIPNLGAARNFQSFDGRCCRFLNIDYLELAEAVKAGSAETDLLKWACNRGRKPSDWEIEVWNAFMQKQGWRDKGFRRLAERKQEFGIASDAVQTSFDFIDADEGRPLRFDRDPVWIQREVKPTISISGLRSAYDQIGGIFHFPRMLDKIRLAAVGRLPAEWLEAKGAPNGFDGLCCRFLCVDYAALQERALSGHKDEEVFEWALSNGRRPSDEEIEIWNDYLSKRCWRDEYTNRLHFRLQQAGMPIEAALTMFDFIDLDEGHAPR